MIRRVFGLGVNADHPAARRAFFAYQLEDFLESRNLQLAVEVLGACRIRLDRAQLPDLGQREVAREECGDRFSIEHACGAAIRELGALSDIGGRIEHWLVSCNQVTVARRDQIRFDEVRALLDRKQIRRKRVLRPVTRGAAMCDDERRSSVKRPPFADIVHRLTIAVRKGDATECANQDHQGSEAHSASTQVITVAHTTMYTRSDQQNE